jgi:hypothetical protein
MDASKPPLAEGVAALLSVDDGFPDPGNRKNRLLKIVGG